MGAQEYAMIMRDLNDPNPDKRRQSIENMDPEILDDMLLRMLVQKLEDANKGVRDAAFQFLKNVQNPLMPQLLAPFFFYRDLEVKNLAVDLMVGLGEACVPQLVEILHSTDPDAQKSSAEQINIIKSHQAVDALLQHLDDPDPNVSFACIEALGSIGDYKAVIPLMETFKTNEDLREVAIEAIGKILSRRVPQDLLDALHGDDPMVTFSVIDALGKIGDPSALDELLKLFPNADELIQGEILKAIGKIIQTSKYFMLPPALLQKVIELFEEEDISGKADLLSLLSRINDSDALQFMLEKYNEDEDESWQQSVYFAIVDFLTLFPGKGLDVLAQFEDDEMKMWMVSHFPPTNKIELFWPTMELYENAAEGTELKQSYLYYLAQFTLAEAVTFIGDTFKSGDEEKIGVVIQALQPEVAVKCIDDIIGSLKADSDYVKEQVYEFLMTVPGYVIDEKLVNIINDVSDLEKIKLLKISDKLLDEHREIVESALKSEDPELIYEAVELLPAVQDVVDSESFKNILNIDNTDLFGKVADVVLEQMPEFLNMVAENAVTADDKIKILLEKAAEKDVLLPSSFLKNTVESADEMISAMSIQQVLMGNDAELQEKIFNKLDGMDPGQVEFFVEFILNLGKSPDFILEKLKNHDDLKQKYLQQ